MNRSQQRLRSCRRRRPLPTLESPGLVRGSSVEAAPDGSAAFNVERPGFSARLTVPRQPKGWVVQAGDTGSIAPEVPPGFAVVEVTATRNGTRAVHGGVDALVSAFAWLGSLPEARGLPVSIAGFGPGATVALEAARSLGSAAPPVLVDLIPARGPVVLSPVFVLEADRGCDPTEAALESFLTGGGHLPAHPVLNHDQRRRLARAIGRGIRRDQRRRGGLPAGAKAAIATLATAIAFTFSAGLGLSTAEAAVTTSYSTLTGGLSVTGDGAADPVLLTCSGGSPTNVLLNGSPIPGGSVGNVRCLEVVSLTVDGGGGADTINLSAVTSLAGNYINLNEVSLFGNTSGDSIIGAGSLGIDSTISGGSGGDTVAGSIGPDLLIDGDSFSDSVVGGAGGAPDTIDYSASPTAVQVDLPVGQATAGLTTDTLSQIQNITGSGFADSLVAGNATGSFVGGGGNDTVVGSLVGPSTIVGGAGSDSLSAGSNGHSHTITGDAGNDTLIGLGQNDTLDGGADQDSLSGGGGADSLIGGTGNDTIAGDAGVDNLQGNDGNDSLLSDAVAGETLNGANDSDTADFTPASSGVNVDISLAVSAGMTFVGLENLRGSSFGDTLSGTVATNLLEGGSGADSINSTGGTDTLRGDGGDDTLFVSGSGSKVLEGGGNNDSITGSVISGSVNTLDGGTGDDTISQGGATANSVLGGAGTDTINLSSAIGINTVSGGLDADTITGGTGGESLAGDGGDDTISGGDGADTLSGGTDNDVLIGGLAADSLDGGSGALDRVQQTGSISASQTITDSQLTGQGPDTLAGIERASLQGSGLLFDASTFSGAVTMAGSFANNQTFLGSAAADSLDAGPGSNGDQLRSTANADHTLSPTLHASGAVNDTISGFEAASLTGGAGSHLMNTTAFLGSVTLDAQGGNDTVRPGSSLGSGDSLIGGLGSDSLQLTATGSNPAIVLTPTSLTGGVTAIGTDSISSIEFASIAGTAFDELIDAGSFVPGLVSLAGLGGSDTLVAPSGSGNNHTLDGGTGSPDRVISQASTSQTINNTSITSLADSVSLSGVEQVSITGGPGPDNLNAGSFSLGSVSLDGADGNDSLTVGVAGPAFNNELTGGEGDDDFLLGGTGGLAGGLVAGGNGFDEMAFSGDADMTLSGSTLNTGIGSLLANGLERASLTGGPSGNQIDASAFPGSASLSGLDGGDTLVPGQSNSTLSGGIGDDRITTGPLADSLSGGTGTDSLFSSGDFSQTVNNVSLTGTGGDSHDGFELVSLTGGPSANLLDASGFSGTANLLGEDGNDTLVVASASPGDIQGGVGTDRLVHSGGTNQTLTGTGLTVDAVFKSIDSFETASLTGSGANNLISSVAFAGPVTLAGGAGNDTLLGGTLGDSISGGAEADSLDGGVGPDSLSGGTEADSLVGGSGVDQVIQTGVQNQGLTDSEVTGEGPDQLSAIESALLSGTAGDDSIDASAFTLGTVELRGGEGADTLTAGQAGSQLFGEGGNDSLAGGDGLDLLFGGDGDDLLNSQAGNPTVDVNNCGADQDEALTDPGDQAVACEVVNGVVVDPGPTGPTGPTGPEPDDTTPPVTKLTGPVKQVVKGKRVQVRLFASCNEVCSARITGSVHYRQTVRRKGKNKVLKRSLPLPRKTVSLQANSRKRVIVKLSPSRSKKLLKLLKSRKAKGTVAKMKVVGTDTAGNASRAAKRNIKVAPPKKKKKG